MNRPGRPTLPPASADESAGQSGTGPALVRVVESAIDQIAQPELRREVMSLALARARTGELPRTGRKLLAFVSGPLYEVLRERFGADSADVVLDDIAPVLNRAAQHELSGLRRRATARDHKRLESGAAKKAVDPRPRSESSLRERSQGPLVLVVDDDALFRAAVDRALASRGYRVLTAINGHVALSMCLQDRPDLVLTDLDMPALDGRELASVLKRTFREQAPPVVLMTASTDALLPDDEIASVVQKPIDPQDLLEIVEPLIASQRWPEG